MMDERSSFAEDARMAYQVAVDVAYTYATIIWSIFNAMLVANSIVVAGAVLLLSGSDKLVVLQALLPLAGLILCATWFLLAKRTQEQGCYFIYSAREIEDQHLAPIVKTLSRGGTFASGDSVSMIIDGREIIRRFTVWGRIIRGEWASYIVVCVFAALYVVLLFHL